MTTKPVSGDRGRSAVRPAAIPIKGWWDIANRVYHKTSDKNLSLMAAGVAFYAMLAVFPGLSAVVSLYALVADPVDVQQHLLSVSAVLPPDVTTIFDQQLSVLVSQANGSLGIGLVISILFALWSAHRGMNALVYAISVAYSEKEDRSFVRFNILTYLLTIGAAFLLVFTLSLMIVLAVVVEWLPLGALTVLATRVAGACLFAGIVIVALALLYRFAPPRRSAVWRWLSVGAICATLIWLVSSFGFSVYVTKFDTYNETYGTLGAIIVLLVWLFLSAFSVIVGAVLNAEMEHQTLRDTTTGPERPIGERGAVVADTIGRTASSSD